jgi:trehalose 6-phosphate synthase
VRRPVVIVSNRGPLSFTHGPDGELVARRGAGGLVSGLAPLVSGTDATWVAAALGDADRQAAGGGVVEAEGLRVRLLAPDPKQFTLAYDVVCNATLWFVHHGLFDASRRPLHDHRFDEAWEAYVAVNDAFAVAVAEVAPPDAAVLVQDYHLCLVGRRLSQLRPDVAAVHFSHTPFTGPDGLRLLPDAVASQLLEGLAAHRAVGFHTARWARRFTQCWDEYASGATAPATFVAPLGPDAEDLGATTSSEATRQAGAELDALLGDRRFIVRVDRIELSKNLLRGFRAYDQFLDAHPEWRERVVLGAFVYPSREGLPEYLAYRQEVDALVAGINARWGTPGWTPVLADSTDDYPRSIAALQRADVLLVNPVRDGLNLVAKEGPLVNQHDAALVLSSEAGAAEELGEVALMVNPFDVGATARALHDALMLSADARAQRAARLRELASRHSPATWLAGQLAAADRPSGAG